MDEIEFREEKRDGWRNRKERDDAEEYIYLCVHIFVAHLLNIKIHHPSTQVDSFQLVSLTLFLYL